MVDISSIGGLANSQNQQNLQKADNKLLKLIASLASGVRLNQASDDVAALSIATQLQSEVSSLRQASSNLAQGASLAQVADAGIEQIQEALTELKSLAQQASNPVINEDTRKTLNQQFQQLAKEIDRIANNTTFGGKTLLNGDVSGDNALSLTGLVSGTQGEDGLEIESLSSASLFDGKQLDLRSSGDASQALAAINEALNKVAGTRAKVGAFQQSVEFAAASIDSAVANQEAARSILQDTDFAETSTGSALADIQRDTTLALIAQGNQLKPGLLQLIG